MATEVFGNIPSTIVTAGGTGAPSPGTVETWTVASSAAFPVVLTGASQLHVTDVAADSEIITVTNISGTTWTVTRGAEGTTPVAHSAGFTVFQVLTAGWLSGALSGFTPAIAGFLAWNYDVGTSASGSTPATNVVNLVRVNIWQAISVTNVVLAVTSAGASLTSGQNFAGLYAGQAVGGYTAGQLIGTSADQTTAWGTSGVKAATLTGGPFALPAGTFVWVAFVSNTGSSTPSFFRTGVLAAAPMNAGFAAATARYATNGTATTALAGSITPGSNALAGTGYWAALS